jgi:hypothetical protein
LILCIRPAKDREAHVLSHAVQEHLCPCGKRNVPHFMGM